MKTLAQLDWRPRTAEPARYPLNPAPSPLLPAPTLSEALGGPEVWIKRDDLIPFGLGGNKVRGLEVILADALEQGADTLVTGAGPLSNHVRATAAAAAHTGLRMVGVFWGGPPRDPEGNHYLCELLGAEIRFTNDADRSSVDRVLEQEAARICAAGGHPYVIPRGGACPLGVIGHVRAVAETMAQCRQSGILPDAVVMAVGSGATLAGWLLGSRLYGASWRVEGIAVSRPAAESRKQIRSLAAEAAERLSFRLRIVDDGLIVHDGFIGAGYGIPSAEGDAALALAARCEGIFLDPTYTAKALAGYRALLAEGRFRKCRTILFMHSGGVPSLFVRRGEHA